jgi:hypothetical protein
MSELVTWLHGYIVTCGVGCLRLYNSCNDVTYVTLLMLE